MPKPFIPDDLALFNDLGQLDLSRDGNVACVVRTVDLANDGYLSNIWVFRPDGDAKLFCAGGSDGQPRWSPDGKSLAFTSAREGSPQVYIVPVDGGEARCISQFPEGAGSIEWRPDGGALHVSCARTLDTDSRDAWRLAEKPRDPNAPELAWRLPFKADGIGYLLGRTFQVYELDIATGEHRPLIEGPFDVLSLTASPDGKQVAFVRTREGREAHRTDLWVLDVASGKQRPLVTQLASTMGPQWSPDGRWIALCGAREEGDAQTRLFGYEVATGDFRQVGSDDMEIASAQGITWRPDGSAVVAIVATRACQHVVEIDWPSGNAHTLVDGERHIAEMALGSQGIAYFSESACAPRELFMADLQGRGERQLSHLNQWWWERTPLMAEIRKFEVPDGEGGTETIEGWLVRAKGATGPQRLMVEAHGGPNSFALLGFPWNTYWNVLCSEGWAVVVPHAVGSTSFGRKFAERLNGHWGELDFPQIMAVVDALQRDQMADDRVVIAGKSYGGYMAAWAIGHTDRFKAAIVAAPVANLESHYGTSDGGYYSQPYTLSSERHIAPERYRELSPVNYIKDCVTPTLLLQGKEDERCPRGQSEEIFAILMHHCKAPCEMVMYPGGDHHLYETGKPSHRLDVVRRMTSWATRWTDRASDAPDNAQRAA